MEDPIGRWFLEVLILGLCGLLALCQAALTNANEGKIRTAASEGDGRAKKLLPFLDQPEPVIALRGLRTLCLLLFAALGMALCQGAGLPFAGAAAVFCLISAPLIMILCKMTPEKVGRKRADQIVLALRPMIAFVTRMMTPFTALERWAARNLARLFGVDPHAPDEEVTEEEIRAMVDMGGENGVLESDEREMIKNVFDFGDLTAADCMTHRTDVTAVWIGDDQETILQTIKESGLSRFPVYKEDIDDIVGVLSTREYLLNMSDKKPRPLRALLRDPYFVPETVPTDVLLRNMQHVKTHIAIVVDEYGGMSGIITMEDLLEEIVGNIYDEFDPAAESEIQPLGDDTWRVNGGVELEAVAEALNVTLPEDEDYDTLGGLIFSRFSTIPQDGTTPSLSLYCTEDGEAPEEGTADQIEIQVETILDRRIEWARVRVIRAGTEEKPETEE
ncbi:MAG: HlyC/CorC family transporter [Clostridia bacterium]|nr:HlyC/CorC family transporter [Clostridia bacterium]